MDFAAQLPAHAVHTVMGCGWSGVKNGELLRRAADQFDAFVTMDRNLEHQQNLPALSLGVVIIRAPSNRLRDLLPLTADILLALEGLPPG